MQSNPIQQRIELICEKWEESKKHKDARIIRLQCQADETDMVDAFYTYMIANDTPILDIGFHFESNCTDVKSFSRLLLEELEETIDIWNTSEKPEGLDFVPIDWKPQFSLDDPKNPAALFVANFNLLAKELNLDSGLFTVAVFKGTGGISLARWIKLASEANICSSVKFLIHDTILHPHFDKIARELATSIHTVAINLNMPKAMEQVAAMGDPKDPGTAYRVVFMKMMNAMGAANEPEAEKYGLECIDIANKNISRDPYWIMQMVVVYVALGNDKIRYKKKSETLAYADKAVETATASKEFFSNDASSTLLAQALMFRGTVLFVHGKWSDAYSDFSIAFQVYREQKNFILAIEAGRMAGASAFKEGNKTKGVQMLADGARVGKALDAQTGQASTFAGLLELLLPANHEPFISSEELNQICLNIYGEDAKRLIYNWKKVPESSLSPSQVN